MSKPEQDKDADILATAKDRFAYSLERSSHNRERAREDIRFAAASPDDPWQWDDRDIKTRLGRPTLTINKMPQHINQVTNDIRQNRPSIRFRPADNKADPEVADILMGLVRHIEANSDADVAYDTAAHHQVVHGLGYIRVLTDYISEDSFDQDIFIGRVKNPLQCYDDPDIIDPAGADRKFFFVEEKLGEDDFKALYPDADAIDWNFSGDGDAGWYSQGEKKVRVCEYFESVEEDATLCLYANGATAYKDDKKLPQGVYAGEKPIKERKAKRCKVIWRKITGQQILDTKEFPSKYIPFARVVGNEWDVDGKTYLSGLVRNAKDSQRMYNTAQSAIVERVMQAPKAPWTAPAAAVEGYETVWQTANTANHSFLPYNHTDDSGNPIPQPKRVQAATIEPGLAQIATGAADDIKSETGQYDASLGQRSNETSGKAIMARQREGDTATYHYVDNLARAVRFLGRIILDMTPRVLDTKRLARILGEDGEASNVVLDPEHSEPLTEYQDEKGAMQRIFNPNIGTYDVYATTGPSFTTRRVEAVEAMTQMTQANPMLWRVIGDQLVQNMDWPGAEEMAERLKLTLLPEVKALATKDDKPDALPPEVEQKMQAMEQHIQQLGEALNNAAKQVDALEADKSKLEVDAYARITDRLKVLVPMMDPAALDFVMRDTVQQAMQHPDPVPDEIPMVKPPEPAPMQPASAGFSLPEGQM